MKPAVLKFIVAITVLAIPISLQLAAQEYRSIQLGSVIMKLQQILLLIAAACPALTRMSQTQTAIAQRKGGLALCLALYMLGLSANASAQTITVFDAPGAGTGAGQGTH